MFSIATWNVNSLRVRLPHVIEWLSTHKPSVLALQETKVTDEHFPEASLKALGYSVMYTGQAAYNGVAILVRHEELPPLATPPLWLDEQKRFLATTYQGIHIVNVYVPNGATVESDKYTYKLTWLENLADYLKKVAHERVVLLGDFNIAPADEDVYDPKAWEGKVLCSEPEREALQTIMALGFKDTFRLFPQPEETYSWWNYRTFAFKRNQGLRIDLILANNLLAEKCTQCKIDLTPRGWERPSDHAPVCAYFEI